MHVLHGRKRTIASAINYAVSNRQNKTQRGQPEEGSLLH